MCLQTALTIASVGLKLAEGAQAGRAAKVEAAVNAHQARLARQTAAVNAQVPLERGREQLGRFVARSAQSNVDLARGSPVDAAAAIAARAHHAHLTALHGGDVAAWENDIAAENARARARAARQGAWLGAGLSLLGQAADENWFARPPRRQGVRGTDFFVPYGG